MSFADRTVIVLDCKESGSLGKIPIELAPKKSSKKSSNSSDPELFFNYQFDKTRLSCSIDGVLEYCRIAYDLLPEETQICVFTSAEKVTRINTWNVQHQCLQKVVDGFGNRSQEAPKDCLSETIEAAVKSLTEPLEPNNQYDYVPKRPPSNYCRLIVVVQPSQLSHPSLTPQDSTCYWSESLQSKVDISALVLKVLTLANQSLLPGQVAVDLCDVWLLALSHSSTSQQRLSQQISQNLHVTVHSIPYSLFVEGMVDLASLHYSLQTVRVSGIPMKERDASENQRSIYEVPLLFPVLPATQARSVPPTFSSSLSSTHLGTGECRTLSTVSLRWKSIDRKTSAENLPCVSLHRITPLNLYSSPTVCLMKHLLSGKPVTLVTVPTGNSENFPSGSIPSTSPLPMSHLLLVHGEDIFLHTLKTSPFSLQDYPLSSYSPTPSPDYRFADFQEMLEFHLLRIPKSEPLPYVQLPHGGSASSLLERHTRYFPYAESDTAIFGTNMTKDLRSLIDPVKQFFLQDEHDEDQLETVIASCASNEIRMYPQWSDHPSLRSDAYLRLWKELLSFARLHSSSYEHRQVIQAMERMWPEASKGPTVEPAPMEIVKEETKPKPRTSSTPLRPGGLYAHLKTEPDAGDHWGQMELAQKERAEEEWKKVDSSQRPVEEMKSPQTKKLKKEMEFEQELEKYDHSSLYYMYWAKHKANPEEFDGRLQDPTYYA